jgi:hypothetical protein
MYPHNYFCQLKSALKDFIQSHFPSSQVYLDDLPTIAEFPREGTFCLSSAYDVTDLGEEGEGSLRVGLQIRIYLPQVEDTDGDSAITDLGTRLGDALLWGVANDSSLAGKIRRINQLRTSYGRDEQAGSYHREYVRHALMELELELVHNRFCFDMSAP